jgi:hypothetical protein
MQLKRAIPLIVTVALPLVFALALPSFFRYNVFKEPDQSVSIITMLTLPFIEGILVVGTCSINRIGKFSRRIFLPWLAVLLFFLAAFLFRMEECACWIIGLPLYLLLASLGGLVAGYFRTRNRSRPKENYSDV